MSDPLRPSTDVAALAAELLEGLRAAPPLTHCITNTVVTGFTANVLLALGAAPWSTSSVRPRCSRGWHPVC